ncbi:hypothetical protein ACHAWX_003258 [Stephanocyclus meneghinianus]
MILLNHILAICICLMARNTQQQLAHAQSDDDYVTTLHFFDENFAVRHGKEKLASDDFIGSSIPPKCIDYLTKGKSSKSRDCIQWMTANPDFGLPTTEPTTTAPTPFFHVSSTFDSVEADPVIEVKLKPVDDTFIELWRPDAPLGTKEKLKIDAIDGFPTKVVMLKFAVGQILKQYNKEGMKVTLVSAKLRLFAITDTEFGGWVQEIDNDWDEEMVVWDDFVCKGERGINEVKRQDLLPRHGDAIGQFGNVTSGNWHEADLTKRLIEIFDGNNGEIYHVSFRLTTDSADGVIYASKEDEHGHSPELVLGFAFSRGPLESNETKLDQNNVEISTGSGSPTAVTQEKTLTTPTEAPSNTPVAITHFPTFSPFATRTDPADPLVAEETSKPTNETPFLSIRPTASPTKTKKATKSPVATGDEPFFQISSTSVVSSSFKMTITAIDELFRMRSLLRHVKRELNAFMSVDEKERPAIKRHLHNVCNQILDSPPEDITLSFEDEVIVETIPKSHSNNGGAIRTSTFRVVGEHHRKWHVVFRTRAIFVNSFFLFTTYQQGVFNLADIEGATAAEAAAVLDQTILYAFIGFQKKSFLEILSNTGRPIYSRTATQDVSVSKVKYSADDGLAFVVDNDAIHASRSENSKSSLTWIQPTLIAGAALLLIASSSAAIIIVRLKQRSQQSEVHDKRSHDASPRSLEETAAPNTPSPAIFSDRWKKKKFDYAEFHDDPDAEDSACDMTPTMTPTTSKYLNRPAQDIKFSQFMNTSFDDSSVSDVSGHLLGAKGTMKNGDGPKEDSSQAESFLLDTTMDSYNMETMSALNVRLENVLQLDGASPRGNFSGSRADEESLITRASAVPSELYSNINTSADSSTMHSYDTGAAYASHLITLDMIKSNDSMPPPPSDAASDSSSYQDDENLCSEIDQKVYFENGDEANTRLFQDAKSYATKRHTNSFHKKAVENIDLGSSRTKSEMINDELSKVIELLKCSEDNGSHETSAEVYFSSDGDTAPTFLGSLSRVKEHESVGYKTFTSAGALNYVSPSEQGCKEKEQDSYATYIGTNKVHLGEDSDPVHFDQEPLKVMYSALNECVQGIDEASG